MFLIVAVVLLILLPSPWNLVGFGVALVLFIGELGFWNRRVRGTRTQPESTDLRGRCARPGSPGRSPSAFRPLRGLHPDGALRATAVTRGPRPARPRCAAS